MTQKISRNREEVADLPRFRLPLNLQLFAGEDDGVIDLETEEEPDDDESESVDVRGEQEDEPEELEVEKVEEKEVKKPEKEKQDKATNDAFQEMRKKAEAAEKRAADLETKRKRDIEVARKYGAEYGVYSDDDVASKYGTSHGITTVEQFEQQLEKERLQKSGLPDELITELQESRKERQERKEREQLDQKEKLDKLLVDSYTELTTAYPDLVKSPEDISPDVWKAFNAGNSGLTLTEVFRAKNHDAIISKTAAASKQRTLNNINSKKHLSTEGDGGAENSADDVTIDSETMDYYKGMGMTKAQATKHHKKLYG